MLLNIITAKITAAINQVFKKETIFLSFFVSNAVLVITHTTTFAMRIIASAFIMSPTVNIKSNSASSEMRLVIKFLVKAITPKIHSTLRDVPTNSIILSFFVFLGIASIISSQISLYLPPMTFLILSPRC